MSRIRTLKPELPSDEKLARVSRDARLAFIYAITQADDYGLLRGSPRQLLGVLFPFDDDVTAESLDGWLGQLVDQGIVRWRCTADGAPVLELVNWSRHQVVHKPAQPRLLNSLRPLPETSPGDSTEVSGKLPGIPRADRRTVGPSEQGPTDQGPPLPATRKKRESAGASWLEPMRAAWEQVNGAGSFPFGQAARELKPLVDAGNTVERIARQLAWYLRVRGLDTADPDPEVIARTRFTPNLRDFRLRFARFDPDRTLEGDSPVADEHGWLVPIAAAWEARYDRGSFPLPEAARELRELTSAGHSAQEIARRLVWYLDNRGAESALGPDEKRRRTFTPSIRDFRLRFGQFDPSAPEAV